MANSKATSRGKPAGKKPTAPKRTRSSPRKKSSTPAAEAEKPYGALVGWASDDLGNRIRLRMQSTKTTPKSPDDIDEIHFYMDKDQAALLGNFLFRVSGKTAPEPVKPKWLARFLRLGQ